MVQNSRQIHDAAHLRRVIRRMAGELVEQHRGTAGLLLVGIRTRGVPLAEALAAEMSEMEGREVPIGTLDITLYRDDLSTIAPQPVVRSTSIPGEQLQGLTVVLCDDVLFTGRTIRAALDALMDYGRPNAVRLAVLIDRGGRELPIQADVVGERVEVNAKQLVDVMFAETDDGREGVFIRSLDDGEEE